MRRVRQLTEMGCGVACVAMVAEVDYFTAYAAIFGLSEPKDHSTEAADLRRGLRRLGIRAAARLIPLAGWRCSELETTAIVKVNPTQDGWHWVVWDAERQCIIDPMTRPYRRHRAISYLRILG